MGAALTPSDRIDGGGGFDTVVLNGDYSAGLNFTAWTMQNVEQIALTAGHSYNLTPADATVAAGQTMIVDGSTLGAADSLTLNASHETNGFYDLRGGAGAGRYISVLRGKFLRVELDQWRSAASWTFRIVRPLTPNINSW